MDNKILDIVSITSLSLGLTMAGLITFKNLIRYFSKKISDTRLERCFIEATGENFEKDLEKMAKFEVLKSIGLKSLIYPHSYEKSALKEYLRRHPKKREEWDREFDLHVKGYIARYQAGINRQRNERAIEIN